MTTPNLGLSKPAGTDTVDIGVINGNMDILDVVVAQLAVLTSDVVITESITPSAVGDLTLSVDANSTYVIEIGYFVDFEASGTNARYAFSTPAGSTGTFGVLGQFDDGVSVNGGDLVETVANTAGKTNGLHGVIHTSSTAGNLVFMIAQGNSTGNSLTLRADTWMRLSKIA